MAGAPLWGLERLWQARLQECAQLGRGLELRDGIQFFECRSERIGETPDRSRFELFVLGLELQVMYGTSQVLGSFEPALDERFVNDHLGGNVRQFASLPRLYLFSHRLKVSLHSINANRDAGDERE